jgi:hypothetical protein
MVIIHIRHQSSIRRQHIFHKNEKSLFGTDLDSAADDIGELPDSEVIRDEVFLLINFGNVAFVGLFNDYLQRGGNLRSRELGAGGRRSKIANCNLRRGAGVDTF